MNKFYAYCLSGFSSVGLALAAFHPYAGALIVAGGCASLVAVRWLEAFEVKTAKELIDPLGHIVNANAQTLGQLVLDVDGLKNSLALVQGQKQFGFR